MKHTALVVLIGMTLLPACSGPAFESDEFSQTAPDGSEVPDGAVVPSTGGKAPLETGGASSGGVSATTTGGTGGTTNEPTGGAPSSGGMTDTDAGTDCAATAPERLEKALAAALPKTVAWSAYKHCDAPTVDPNTTTTVVAGSACSGATCGACSLVWSAPVFNVDHTAAAASYRVTCNAPGEDGYNYCDATWAAQYAKACTLSFQATGSATFAWATTNDAGGVRTVAGTATTGDFAVTASNTCTATAPSDAHLDQAVADGIAHLPVAPAGCQ